MTRVLALDVGTSSVRTLVYDEHGGEVENSLTRALVEHRGQGEIDAPPLLDQTLEVVAQGERFGGIDARAISAFWHSLVAVDDDLRPLTPILTWEDVRSAPQATALADELHEDAVHARTGCPIHSSFWPAKLRRLAEEEPDVFAEAAWFVSFPDLVFQRLTGELGTSVSIASGTGLLDLGRMRWDPELLDVVGITADRLPPLLDHATAAGGWYPTVGDGACSNVGAGCVTRDRAALMIGTSAAYRVVYEPTGELLMPGLFRYRLDERRIVDGGSDSNGGNVPAWLDLTLGLREPVALGDPDAHGLTFLPLLGGERSPGWRADRRGAIEGLTFATRPEQIFQAALEGVAYRIAEIVDLLPGVTEIV